MYSNALQFKLVSPRKKNDSQVKKRDHMVHGLIAHGEKAYKENQLKQKAAREADPRTLGEKTADAQKSIGGWYNKYIVEPWNEHQIYQRYILAPFMMTCEIMNQHIIEP